MSQNQHLQAETAAMVRIRRDMEKQIDSVIFYSSFLITLDILSKIAFK